VSDNRTKEQIHAALGIVSAKLLDEISEILWCWDASQEDEIFGRHMPSKEFADYLIRRIAGAAFDVFAKQSAPPTTGM
jgi:hypothetical protein